MEGHCAVANYASIPSASKSSFSFSVPRHTCSKTGFKLSKLSNEYVRAGLEPKLFADSRISWASLGLRQSSEILERRCSAVLNEDISDTEVDVEDLIMEQENRIRSRAIEVRDRLRGTSIFLVGMMGSGKTTVGKILAEKLEYCFFDSDKVVEQAAGGASVKQIFEENGEESFRESESIVIQQLSSILRLVVSTGGGTVTRRENWGHMRAGITVWLNVPVDTLAERMGDSSELTARPFLAGQAGEGSEQPGVSQGDALAKLSTIFEERQRLYTPSDVHVSVAAMSAELGVPPSAIQPRQIVLQVLDQLYEIIERRRMRDEAMMTN